MHFQNSQTALFLAAHDCPLEVVKVLVQARANPDLQDKVNYKLMPTCEYSAFLQSTICNGIIVVSQNRVDSRRCCVR